jgi:hypothetical protein
VKPCKGNGIELRPITPKGFEMVARGLRFAPTPGYFLLPLRAICNPDSMPLPSQGFTGTKKHSLRNIELEPHHIIEQAPQRASIIAPPRHMLINQRLH